MLEVGKINQRISSIIEKLLVNKRVDDSFVRQFYSSFQQPSLQIGVVGKMKVGKSSLVNALVFGGDVLPSGSEPVTVTLTKITYGSENKSVIEFLSAEDVNSLKELASYTGDDVKLISQRDNASEILNSLPKGYETLLGSSLDNIKNEQLMDYVSASGKYASLVKSVTITLCNDSLRAITIIDTPGFNDPVSSRGELTKKQLSDCHVVLFVHNSDGYDETDGELLVTQIEYAGVSKLIDVFNRMDTRRSLKLNEWDSKVEDFKTDREEYISVKEHPQSARLIKESYAVPVSAFMALCGLNSKDKHSDFIKRKICEFEERYPELTANDVNSLEEALFKYSNISRIADILNNVSIEGKQYLIDKPIKTLEGKMRSIIEVIESDIVVAESDLKILKQGKDSALSDLKGLTDFMKSIKETITISPLEIKLNECIANSRHNIQTIREEESNSFSKSKYPEPGAFSRGVTKGNIGAYNTTLSHFQSLLRGELESLVRTLEAKCNEYIGRAIESLENPKISEARRDNFKERAKNASKELLQKVNIIVDAYAISSLPTGDAEQWSLLRSDFLSHYDDNFVDEKLKDFKNVSHKIGVPMFILDMIIQMEEEMTAELSSTPAEIQLKIEEAQKGLDSLNEELKWAKSQLNEILSI